MREGPRPRQPQCSNCYKIRGNQTSQLNSEGLVIHLLLPSLPQRLIWQPQPTSRPHTFPGTACRAMWQLSATFCQLPFLQEKRDLVTKPMQPDDVQRLVTQCAFMKAAGGHIFILQPSFAFTLPHWILWAAHLPFVPHTKDLKSITISSFFRNYVQGEERTRLEDISREEGGMGGVRGGARMPALKKGLKVSPKSYVAGSFCIKKKKSSPCGPYFPGTFHSMDAVRKYILFIGSK